MSDTPVNRRLETAADCLSTLSPYSYAESYLIIQAVAACRPISEIAKLLTRSPQNLRVYCRWCTAEAITTIVHAPACATHYASYRERREAGEPWDSIEASWAAVKSSLRIR